MMQDTEKKKHAETAERYSSSMLENSAIYSLLKVHFG